MLRLLGLDNHYNKQGFRTCDMTGLKVHQSAERQVKRFSIVAILALCIGGVFALLLALTRWEAVGLLGREMFYMSLSVHAWNLLIFWMVFMEIAILYVGGPSCSDGVWSGLPLPPSAGL